MKKALFTTICCFIVFILPAQQRWSNNYLESENPFGKDLNESYDKGYLFTGRFGPNYPNFNWLIKTDINGNLLWKKVLGELNSYSSLADDICLDNSGNIYLSGSTNFYGDDNSDPIIMKLNPCGEKVWCRVFIEEGNNYCSDVVLTPDKDVVVLLKYMNTIHISDRICLAKFDSSGNLLWNQCFNGSDSSVHNEEAREITLTPEGGFLLTGECYYESPDPPHAWWIKPYYIKVDSAGNFEWEMVVHGEIIDKGGAAWNTVLSPDRNYYYSSISHYYHPPFGDAPALLKMDLNGSIIDIYDLAPVGEYGKMVQAKFITDTTLMASATWGDGGGPEAVIIDTLGNIQYSLQLLDNEWMANTEVTFDKKLLFLTKIHDQNDNFSTYLFKLNQQLGSDTLYTQLFNYDSLCPNQIVSDTIPIEGCGLIVGMEELVDGNNNKIPELLIYPSPAQNQFTLQCEALNESSTKAEIYDLYGQRVMSLEIPKGQTETTVKTEGWQKGVYLVQVWRAGGTLVSGKVVIE
ncbi:MAG: hypothetical protein CO098_01100 [Bacteroidetes bacterium CG_4_9_14_3_um_filter_41_19]|nr:MAG: hypothetical protein CO098_01100 [Bacteroidetes bacterium CG_4_9_14_3_um_filter_41_19]